MSYVPDARALFERVIPTFSAERARPLWERWARYEYQFGDLEAAQKLEKRIAEVYPTGALHAVAFVNAEELMKLVIDPPIKRFAQRHTYLGTDAIAARDLGFAMAGRQPAGASYSTSSLEKRTDSLLSITSAAHMPPTQPPPKRQPSPELKRREESVKPEFAPPAKRARPMSPPRDRDRDRFSDGPRRRLGSPAAWEKDRDREPHPMKRDRELDYKSTTLPAVLTWFVGQLPNPGSFDGQFSLLARRSAIARGNVTHAGCFCCLFRRPHIQDGRSYDAVPKCCYPERYAATKPAASTSSATYVVVLFV
jgi:cleavage stimulation factor subunit 3